MIKKLFDGLAIICGILVFIFAMAVDSASYVPIKICAVCTTYLVIYVFLKYRNAEYIDSDGEDYE